MSLDRAITQLEEELAALGLGTKDQPAEGTTEWFLLRAKAIGLSFLRKARQMNGAPPAEIERHFRKASIEVKAL